MHCKGQDAAGQAAGPRLGDAESRQCADIAQVSSSLLDRPLWRPRGKTEESRGTLALCGPSQGAPVEHPYPARTLAHSQKTSREGSMGCIIWVYIYSETEDKSENVNFGSSFCED